MKIGTPVVTSYYRVSGAGNDFLVLVEPSQPPHAEQIRSWCRRGVSLGADGVITLKRVDGGARMVYYNADGGRSDLCLNGCRCAAQLAFTLGWAPLSVGEMILLTDVGPLRARPIEDGQIEVELPAIVGEPAPAVLTVDGEEWRGWRIEVGVPHFVVAWGKSLGRLAVGEIGPRLRAHPDLGTAGANVDFVRFTGRQRCEIRTFERGVEAETLACGTGVVATAAVGVATGQLVLPASVLTAGGYELRIDEDLAEGRLRSPRLAGDARIVSRGEILPAAARLPAPPTWS